MFREQTAAAVMDDSHTRLVRRGLVAHPTDGEWSTTRFRKRRAEAPLGMEAPFGCESSAQRAQSIQTETRGAGSCASTCSESFVHPKAQPQPSLLADINNDKDQFFSSSSQRMQAMRIVKNEP